MFKLIELPWHHAGHAVGPWGAKGQFVHLFVRLVVLQLLQCYQHLVPIVHPRLCQLLQHRNQKNNHQICFLLIIQFLIFGAHAVGIYLFKHREVCGTWSWQMLYFFIRVLTTTTIKLPSLDFFFQFVFKYNS